MNLKNVEILRMFFFRLAGVRAGEFEQPQVFPHPDLAGARPGHALWKNLGFRSFMLSEFMGFFGNHFYQIALPWLVMELTGNPAALGMAIILNGAARMTLVLFGGVLCDRFSPRALLLSASAVRAVLLASLVGLLVSRQISLGVLYGLCFASGIPDAIYMPARGTLLPLLIGRDWLQIGNSIVMSQEKIWGLIGPSVSGMIITWLGRSDALAGGSEKHYLAAAAAFGLNFLAILASMAILLPLKINWVRGQRASERSAAVHGGSFRGLIKAIWEQPVLRNAFLMVYGLNVASAAPLYIGMPMFAVNRFADGAQALGFLTSSMGFGALIGTLLAGLLPRVAPRSMGRLFIASASMLVTGIILLLTAANLGVAILSMLLVSILISYVNIVGITQIQRETPPDLLGRMMGLLNMR